MIRALAVALVLLLAPDALAKGKKKAAPAKRTPAAQVEKVHAFSEEPIARLQVVDTRGDRAVVENKQGGAVLVRAGDHLGAEGLEVVKVTLGCVQLKSEDADLTLCVDVPEVPRT
ncbi:MAG: hypothetical protein IPJ65_09205 [Archangiaceae bacterium]|nr:hypothetical protein [Archangiaceae bacterium]